jgi:hypothetical protein
MDVPFVQQLWHNLRCNAEKENHSVMSGNNLCNATTSLVITRCVLALDKHVICCILIYYTCSNLVMWFYFLPSLEWRWVFFTLYHT